MKGRWTGKDPLDCGLHKRLAVDDVIDERAWNRARAAGDIIGACRANCTGFLVAEPSRDDTGTSILWFEARCLKCGHVTAAPGGRVLRRSSAHTETPTGWWAQRTRKAG